jgi:hypothetical protein
LSTSNTIVERSPKADILTLFYDNDQGQSFAGDALDALRAAYAANDVGGQTRIVGLLDYFEEQLPSLGVRGLIAYLEGRRVWHYLGEDPVFETSDTPCMAFTALDGNGKVTLLALACCYKYPADDEEGWWRETILRRLRSI